MLELIVSSYHCSHVICITCCPTTRKLSEEPLQGGVLIVNTSNISKNNKMGMSKGNNNSVKSSVHCYCIDKRQWAENQHQQQSMSEQNNTRTVHRRNCREYLQTVAESAALGAGFPSQPRANGHDSTSARGLHDTGVTLWFRRLLDQRHGR